MKWSMIVPATLAAVAAVLAGWRFADSRADERAWAMLVERAGPSDSTFDRAMVEALPEPARRYFRYTIATGTPLTTAVEIEMRGELGRGDKDDPRYRPMTARQVLVPPYGLVWRLAAAPIGGSDGATPENSWTRFWLFGLVPVVRVAGDPDHHRSAFGRVVAEAAFWAPASLLPGQNVRWVPVDDSTARAVVRYGPFEQAVDITVESDGRPSRVSIQRWSAENAEKVYREQPFGGYLSDFRDFDGYRLPARVEGGNWIGTDDYFPFYKAEVVAIRFPQRD